MTEALRNDGRIEVPVDLDAVTDVGPEEADAGEAAASQRVWEAARHWYAAGMHPAIQVCVRHNGRVVLDRAIGHGWGNAPSDSVDAERVTVGTGTPFCVFSTAKGVSVTVLHMLIERGELGLDTPVREYLPEFTGHRKERITVRHVLTHSAGLTIPTGPRPDLKRSEDSAYTREMLGRMRTVYPPGMVHMYHALTWGPIVRELVLAATGRSIREIVAAEILDPLGFRWTNYGVTEDDLPLVALSHATGKPPSPVIEAGYRVLVGGTMAQTMKAANSRRFLTGIVPSSNLVSTASELSRFAELLRCGGELDGHRVLRPETIAAATTPARRLRPDLASGGMPMRWGTGYMLGSKRFGPFGLAAPAAFGHTGLTQIAMWADPQRDLAVGIVSSGKPGAHPEAKRYPALLDTITREFGPR
ncbi:serine hydrolase [Tsukamurella soli]|uniref:Lipase LipE n=1 Tax=Tsukamurella soli TaxID=644556 RepID=A0ABP8JTK7_9ACTN